MSTRMKATCPNHYAALAHIADRMSLAREDARKSFTTAPIRRIKAELFCFLLIWVPHKYNSPTRKVATLSVFAVYVAIEIGAAFNLAMLPPQFTFVRGLVLVLLGRMWGLELNNFTGVEFIQDSDD